MLIWKVSTSQHGSSQFARMKMRNSRPSTPKQTKRTCRKHWASSDCSERLTSFRREIIDIVRKWEAKTDLKRTFPNPCQGDIEAVRDCVLRPSWRKRSLSRFRRRRKKSNVGTLICAPGKCIETYTHSKPVLVFSDWNKSKCCRHFSTVMFSRFRTFC